jgi:hypothetical protein
VRPRLIAGVFILGIASSTMWAQQAANTPLSDATRNQVEGFVGSLRLAIDSAASKLNERARQAWPGVVIRLDYQTPPIVTGLLLPDSGAIFHVLIPAIADVDWKLAAMIAARRAAPPPPPGVGGGRTVANGTVADPDPATPVVPPLTEPDKEYTTFMRLALIDALVDHALSLPIPSGQYLTVIADELPSQPLSPFDPRSRTLILQLKSEDLIALRENRITRDEAKARIKESRYPN